MNAHDEESDEPQTNLEGNLEKRMRYNEEKEEERERKKESNIVSNITYLLTYPTRHKFRKVVSFQCKPEIHQNFKRFCANLEKPLSGCFEVALQDFMVKYQGLLPVKPVFNLQIQDALGEDSNDNGDSTLHCTTKNCLGVVAGFATLRGDKDGKRWPFCELHLKEKLLDRANWSAADGH